MKASYEFPFNALNGWTVVANACHWDIVDPPARRTFRFRPQWIRTNDRLSPSRGSEVPLPPIGDVRAEMRRHCRNHRAHWVWSDRWGDTAQADFGSRLYRANLNKNSRSWHRCVRCQTWPGRKKDGSECLGELYFTTVYGSMCCGGPTGTKSPRQPSSRTPSLLYFHL